MWLVAQLSVPHTQHWVHQYWHVGKEGEIDMCVAPRPFHDPKFWSTQEKYAKNRRQAVNDEWRLSTFMNSSS